MRLPKIEAVAFDMDGLMFNTEDLYDQVGQTLLARRGLSFTRQLKHAMMGLPGPEAFQVMRKRCDLDDSVEQLQSETDQIFEKLLPAEIRLMPGLEVLMESLEASGIPKAVATSSHRQFATQALGFFDLEPRFEFVLTSDDIAKGKPHPEIYMTAASRFGVKPSAMLVLEDSYTGSKSGAASGAYTIAVPTEHSVDMDFSHVDHVANSLDDDAILQLILR